MSGPDSQDYEPTEAEKASASVALANYNRFKQKYEPQLLAMRDKAAKGDASQILRARANADTMQALTQPSYRAAQAPTYAPDLSKALQGQMGVANTSGKKIQNTMGSNVLGVARKQEADSTTGMSKLSRLETSAALGRAKANQQVAQAKVNAGVQLGSAMFMQGMDNRDTGGTFFTPNERMGYGVQGPPKEIRSVSDRWNNFWG